MLTSITPLGERGRKRRWGETTAWYITGSALGGAAVGALAGGLGTALSAANPAATAVLALAAVACFIAAFTDARGVRPRSWRRQVNEDWLGRYRGWVVGGGFGVQLGFGIVTIVSSASVYVALLLGVLSGSFWGALAIGLTFGTLRALPLLTVHRVRDNEALGRLHRRVGLLAPGVARATAGVLATAGAALTVVAITGA